MRNSMLSVLFGVFIPFVSAASLASDPEQSAPSGKLAALETTVLQRDLASLGAPIKSERSLQRHLSLGLGESPLRYLSKPALNRFVRSLQFNDDGLTTYRYTDLESELTPTQIFQVLALFGQQHQTRFMKGARITTILDQEIMQGDIPGVMPAGFGDCEIPSPTQPLECGGHKNYRCSSPGTCAPSDTLICTDNC